MKTRLAMIAAAVALAANANTPPAITNVRASQREGTKLVDIYYDAADADGDLLKVRIEISDNDGAKYSVPAFSLTGDIGEGIAPGSGKHIVWDAGTDWDGEYSDQMRVKVLPSTRRVSQVWSGAMKFRPAASSWARTAARKAVARRAT